MVAPALRNRKKKRGSTIRCLMGGILLFSIFSSYAILSLFNNDPASSLTRSYHEMSLLLTHPNAMNFLGNRELGRSSITAQDVQAERKLRSDQITMLENNQPPVGDSRYLLHNDEQEVLPYGHVMRELGQRVLSRSIASSNVIVYTSFTATSSVASNLLKQAQSQGHATHHVVSSNYSQQYLDEWYYNSPAKQQVGGWWLLTLLDADKVFSSPPAATKFLSSGGPTMTYVVLKVTASTGGCELAPFNYTFTGMDTVAQFLQHQYKVQLLSASDFWNGRDLGGVNKSPDNPYGVFNPNDLLTNDNLEEFFQWGAKAAALSKSLMRNHRDLNSQRPAVFQAYLFLTQGLDLAIPSRRAYIQNGEVQRKTWIWPYNNVTQERLDFMERVPFLKCPAHHERLRIEFSADTHDSSQYGALSIFCNETDVTQQVLSSYKDGSSSVKQLWMNTKHSSTAEAVCVKLNCDTFISSSSIFDSFLGSNNNEPTTDRYQVACKTRILPSTKPQPVPKKDPEATKSKKDKKTKADNHRPPNFLVILLDPLSKTQFDQIMPKTHALLTQSDLAFVHYPKYTTVGNNSGPNQVALYSGTELKDRNGVSGGGRRWLWDRLNDMGYATMKAEDGCIANSNMMQSIQPNTTHGAALHELFCFHFARPNCVGGTLAADHLLNHAESFIRTYQKSSHPWAAFVSLVDTHEDTMTLGAVIDESVRDFVNWALLSKERRSNTIITVLSDHGLHYGPYFQSLAGERERSQPLLYMRVPPKTGRKRRTMRYNRDAWLTPHDVHATLLEFAGLEQEETIMGMPLTNETLAPSRVNCSNAPGVPEHHCKILESEDLQERDDVPIAPSLLSFYADIPKDQRVKNNKCPAPKNSMAKAFDMMKKVGKTCRCATSHREWFDCKEHPWGSVAKAQKKNNPEETFVMLKCEKRPLHLETRVARNDALLARVREKQLKLSQKDKRKPRPNILIIEVDSVSVQYANRHFPKTRALLKRFRKTSPEAQCRDGLCGVDFSKFGVVGPNSISNQVASLSGCFTTLRHESCSEKTAAVGDICQDSSMYEYGMRLTNIGPGQHMVYCPVDAPQSFLYDIAKEQGYVTFFGEEFCFPGSPWVMQDNVFPLKADIELHPAFCRFNKLMFPSNGELFKETHAKCTEGIAGGTRVQKIGLEMLKQMWFTYGDVPKFAYLNSMAAHVYTTNTPMVGFDAEEYDEYLAHFLESLMRRPDAGQNIVIVRSDHGLQGGYAIPTDYSTQMEQRHPWTEMIIPEKTPSVATAVTNSDKAVTPFDLYVTLRDLMTAGSMPSSAFPWATNLLKDGVSPSRSCSESMVLPEYCPANDLPAPTFGVCNMFETGQALFCRDPTNGARLFKDRAAYEWVQANPPVVEPFVLKAERKQTSTGRNGTFHLKGFLTNTTVVNDVVSLLTKKENIVQEKLALPCSGKNRPKALPAFQRAGEVWNDLHAVREQHSEKGADVSGGMFLHHRQAYVLATIIQSLAWASLGKEPIRVCETGFGGGHSAALFLAASERVELITFDKFDRPYQLPALGDLRTKFGTDRIRHVAGDTCETVPAFFAKEKNERQCDFIHGSSQCPSDMKDLVQHLRPAGIVTASAMSSLKDDANVYFGPNAQWRQLRRDSCVTNIVCFREKKRQLSEPDVFAIKGADLQHEFCIGMNTGRCSDPPPGRRNVEVKEVKYDKICETRQIDIPL